MDVDTVIAEAVQADQQAEQATPEVEVQETEQDIAKKADSELTPEQLSKRERNRESHLKSRLARITRENRNLQARVAQQEPVKTNAKPDINTFKGSWEEYNEALTDWKLEEKLSAKDKETQESRKAEEATNWKQAQAERTASQATEVMQKLPDFQSLFQANYDILESFDNTYIEQAFYESDNPELAAYALMKEGKLEALTQLSPVRAAIEIAKAEDRGRAYLKADKPVSKAPAPMSAVKGTGSPGKSIESMSVSELMKWQKKGQAK